MPTSLKIPAADGFLLGANRHDAEGPTRGWVLIHPAMGVKQEYYFGFASFVAAQGFSALTWDYRGVAASRPAPPGRVSLREWAEKDMEGIQQWALAQGAPVGVLGHSLGAQLLGLVPSSTALKAIVGVGSQSGDWRNWPFPYDIGLLVLASIVLPGVTGLFGKLPQGLMGEELPRGPVVDWAKWIRSKGYLLSEGKEIVEQYARLTCPMTGFSIDDDKYAPSRSVDRLFAIYKNAQVERIHLTPAELGVKQVGHFGAFRTKFKETLWPQLLRPLERALVPLRAAG